MNILQNKTIRSALGGAIGGFLAWMLSEPIALLMLTPTRDIGLILFHDALWAVPIGLMLGLVLGAAEGVSLRSLQMTLRGGVIGMVVGLIGGTIGVVIAEIVFQQVQWLCFIGRGIGWGIFGLFLGTSEGIRRFSLKGTINAAIGGAIGGFVGGVLFDMVGLFTGFIGGGTISRAIALTVLGACIGILIALVEQALAEATLLVVQGRQEGRTILLDKPRTVFGRNESNDVYMSDTGIVPRHAEIRAESGGYAIVPLDGSVTVNQSVTQHHLLQSDDQIDLGAARLVYRPRRRDVRASANQPVAPALPKMQPRVEPQIRAPREPRMMAAAQKLCPRCAHANRPEAKYCQRCGQRI